MLALLMRASKDRSVAAAPQQSSEEMQEGAMDNPAEELAEQPDHTGEALRHLGMAEKYAGPKKGALCVHLKLARHHMQKHRKS
jgi:hypothetical protein